MHVNPWCSLRPHQQSLRLRLLYSTVLHIMFVGNAGVIGHSPNSSGHMELCSQKKLRHKRFTVKSSPQPQIPEVQTTCLIDGVGKHIWDPECIPKESAVEFPSSRSPSTAPRPLQLLLLRVWKQSSGSGFRRWSLGSMDLYRKCLAICRSFLPAAACWSQMRVGK